MFVPRKRERERERERDHEAGFVIRHVSVDLTYGFRALWAMNYICAAELFASGDPREIYKLVDGPRTKGAFGSIVFGRHVATKQLVHGR